MRRFLVTAVLLIVAAVLGCDTLAPDSPSNGDTYQLAYMQPIPSDSAVLDTWSIRLNWTVEGLTPADSEFTETVRLFEHATGTLVDSRQAQSHSAVFRLLSPDKYQWQVTGENGDEVLGVSSRWTFQTTVDPPGPEVPTPLIPEAGDTLSRLEIYLWWNEVPHPDGVSAQFYRVYLREEDSDFSMIADSLTDNYHAFTTTDSTGHFTWYVTAYDDRGNENTSGTSHFYLDVEPLVVIPEIENSWYCSYPQKDAGYFKIFGVRIIPLENTRALLAYWRYEEGGNTIPPPSYHMDMVEIGDSSATPLLTNLNYSGIQAGLMRGDRRSYLGARYSSQKVYWGYDDLAGAYYKAVDQSLDISKHDMNGSVLWTRTFCETPVHTTVVDGNGDTLTMILNGFTTISSMTAGSSQTFIVGGNVIRVGEEEARFFAGALDSDGNEVWKFVDGGSKNRYCRYITEVATGYLAIGSRRAPESGSQQLQLWKLSTSGGLLSVDDLPYSGNRINMRTAKLSDGRIVVLLRIDNAPPHLLLMEENGQITWSRDIFPDYTPTYPSLHPVMLAVTTNDQIVVATEKEILAVDGMNLPVWSNEMASPDEIAAIAPAPDGGIYFITQLDLWAKTNELGQCEDILLND